jgi:hypothetical protein
MVKAAEKGPRCDGAKTLGDAMERGVLGQGSMSSLLGVVARVGGQDPAQVHVAEDHDVVQAFSSDRADEAFDGPFCQGDRGAVGRSRMPMAARRRVTA